MDNRARTRSPPRERVGVVARRCGPRVRNQPDICSAAFAASARHHLAVAAIPSFSGVASAQKRLAKSEWSTRYGRSRTNAISLSSLAMRTPTSAPIASVHSESWLQRGCATPSARPIDGSTTNPCVT
eukprot:435748-Prymnesium_polylepis.1